MREATAKSGNLVAESSPGERGGAVLYYSGGAIHDSDRDGPPYPIRQSAPRPCQSPANRFASFARRSNSKLRISGGGGFHSEDGSGGVPPLHPSSTAAALAPLEARHSWNGGHGGSVPGQDRGAVPESTSYDRSSATFVLDEGAAVCTGVSVVATHPPKPKRSISERISHKIGKLLGGGGSSSGK